MTTDLIPLQTIADQELLDRFAAIVGRSLRVDRSRVTADTTLDALGAESIDIVEITLDVETEFTVRMPERTILQLATEVAGDGVFEENATLTGPGLELLEARMPGLVPPDIAAGTPVAALGSVFLRVEAWLRLIRGLLEATPRVCDLCGGRLVQGGPDRVKCPACQRSLDVPAGDEIGRAWVRQWLATRRS